MSLEKNQEFKKSKSSSFEEQSKSENDNNLTEDEISFYRNYSTRKHSLFLEQIFKEALKKEIF